MVDRLTVDEFFDAMREQHVYPLIDTPTARRVVQAVVRAYGADYPIKDRWPVLDLESAYEGHVNAHENLLEFHKNGYNGTIHLQGFDDSPGTGSLDRISSAISDRTLLGKSVEVTVLVGTRG